MCTGILITKYENNPMNVQPILLSSAYLFSHSKNITRTKWFETGHHLPKYGHTLPKKQMGQVSPTLNHAHASHTPTTQIINTTSSRLKAEGNQKLGLNLTTAVRNLPHVHAIESRIIIIIIVNYCIVLSYHYRYCSFLTICAALHDTHTRIYTPVKISF